MSVVALCDWEENRYDDSDGYVALWDVDTHELRSELTWTTRGACNKPFPRTVPMTIENLEVARQYLENNIYDRIRAAEHRDVLEPDKIMAGQRVRLSRDHRNMAKTVTVETCPRCGGTGKWVNPRYENDVRECLACKGTGQKATKYEKKKNASGKQEWNYFKAGLAGTVVSVHCYETCYANGYNHPGRHNLQCIVLLDNGQEMKCPLEKLSLDKDPMSDDMLRERARNLSFSFNFKPLLSSHGGWLDNNWALSFCTEHAQEWPK